ncbi:hypothetical protein THAOC_27202, partial [Thalassiosira oceanica]
ASAGAMWESRDGPAARTRLPARGTYEQEGRGLRAGAKTSAGRFSGNIGFFPTYDGGAEQQDPLGALLPWRFCISLQVETVSTLLVDWGWGYLHRQLADEVVKVAPAQMDGQGSKGEQLGKLRAEREAKAIMPGKLRAEREAKAIMKLAGRDKSQWCNLHVIG